MHYQEPIHRPDEVHDNRLAVGTVVEVNVDVVAGIRHVDDVFAVQGVDGFSGSRAGLLGAEVILVALSSTGHTDRYNYILAKLRIRDTA